MLLGNNVFDMNSLKHLNAAASLKRYRALFMDA